MECYAECCAWSAMRSAVHGVLCYAECCAWSAVHGVLCYAECCAWSAVHGVLCYAECCAWSAAVRMGQLRMLRLHGRRCSAMRRAWFGGMPQDAAGCLWMPRRAASRDVQRHVTCSVT